MNNKFLKNIIFFISLVLFTSSLTSCTGSEDLQYVDRTAPTVASASHSDNEYIMPTDTISFVFSETINKSVFDDSNITGTLVSANYTPTWSTTTTTDDTITITPNPAWTELTGQTIAISAQDLEQNIVYASLTVNVDGTPPTINSVDPVSGSTIGGSQQIEITFSETIDTALSTPTGSLVAQGSTAVWTQTTFTNDTLQISTTSAWTTDGDVSITAYDRAGNSVSANYNYIVDITAPTVTPNIANGSTINASQVLVFDFSETIAATTYDGSLETINSPTKSWSQNVSTNDRLTITPNTTWADTSGSLQPFIISSTDLYGNNLDYTLNLIVDATVPTITSQSHTTNLTLEPTERIDFTFSELIDFTTLTLSGTFASTLNPSTAYNEDTNTLTLYPATTWADNAGLILNIDVDDVNGNPLVTATNTYSIDGVAPILTESPGNGAFISTTEAIKLTLDETINIASIDITVNNSSTIAITETTFSNDTIIISPRSTWNSGSVTLDITLTDMYANETTATLSYDATTTGEVTYTSNPPMSTNLKNSDTIAIVFSEAMNTVQGLTLSGTMTGGQTYDWSSTTDTLYITPTTTWTNGKDKTLSFTVDNVGSAKTANVLLNYNIVSDAIHVSTAGSDGTGDGSASAPYATLYYAVSQIATTPVAIHMAGGSYSYGDGAEVISVTDDSTYLYGGFNSAFSTRDIDANTTTITSTRTYAYANAITLSGDDFIFDGITLDLDLTSPTNGKGLFFNDVNGIVRNSTFKNSCAGSCGHLHYIMSGPGSENTSTVNEIIIRNNIFENLATTSATDDITGIFVRYSDKITIANNTFQGLSSDNTAHAIYLTSLTSDYDRNIYNNTFYNLTNTGTANTSAVTMNIVNRATVKDNLITFGNCASCSLKGVNVTSGASAISSGIEIDSNSIYTAVPGLASYAVYSLSNATSVTMKNNSIFVSNHSTSAGIYVASATANNRILNNSIVATNTSTGYGIVLGDDSLSFIDNNIFHDLGVGIYTASNTVQIKSINNNDFSSMGTSLITTTSGTYTDICSGSFGTGGCGATLATPNTISSNINDTVVFNDTDGADNIITTNSDNDLTLDASCPVAIKEGALFATSSGKDAANTIRTDPASMGAFEF